MRLLLQLLLLGQTTTCIGHVALAFALVPKTDRIGQVRIAANTCFACNSNWIISARNQHNRYSSTSSARSLSSNSEHLSLSSDSPPLSKPTSLPAPYTDRRNHEKEAQFNFGAVAKYGGAIAIQLILIYSVLSSLDWMTRRLASQQRFAFSSNQAKVINFILFYVFSLKSRVLNPLANNRPQVKTMEISGVASTRKMPAWTPPGVVFPIMWLLIIAPIRALAASMIVQETSQYASSTIMALMLHLSIGDVWNTINNVEQRYGVSVTGVMAVWLSKAYAAYRFYQVVPRAGQLLALPLIWLTIAAALITATWKLNPNPATGKADPLYPTRHQDTRFVWFSNK